MKIVTSLSFQGQCREAFEFYAKVLGGKITAAIPYADAPPGMPITDQKYKSWLLHCWSVALLHHRRRISSRKALPKEHRSKASPNTTSKTA